jgi:hypothetical protein
MHGILAPNVISGFMTAVAVSLSAGCGSGGSASPATDDTASHEPAAAAPAGAWETAPGEAQIDSGGIGAARVGTTLAGIREALPPDLRLGDLDTGFMVDLNAIPVLRGEDTLYYLVFWADETPDDGSVPLLAATDHTEVRTGEGIGPGSTLAEAATQYGSPTLAYNAMDEMREYASFPGYRHTRVRFRVAPGDTVMLAGRYTNEDDYGETTRFDGNARIMMVFVDLRQQ